jgi:hypothetical protein
LFAQVRSLQLCWLVRLRPRRCRPWALLKQEIPDIAAECFCAACGQRHLWSQVGDPLRIWFPPPPVAVTRRDDATAIIEVNSKPRRHRISRAPEAASEVSGLNVGRPATAHVAAWERPRCSPPDRRGHQGPPGYDLRSDTASNEMHVCRRSCRASARRPPLERTTRACNCDRYALHRSVTWFDWWVRSLRAARQPVSF